MKRKTRVIVALSCTLAIGIVASSALVLYFPSPSCSEDDFETAIHVTGRLLDIPWVSKTGAPLFDDSCLPSRVRLQRRLRNVLSPSAQHSVGLGPVDPKTTRYNMQSTNCQVSVEAVVSANRVVCAKVRVYGATKVADAIINVLGKWVPTAEVPIELGMSDTRLWKETKEDAEHGGPSNPHSPSAQGSDGR